MCGIAGIVSFSASPRDESGVVKSMREAVAHRGPDDAGLYQSRDLRATFGHRRLSIVDLTPAGHQPMSNEDGRIWITFNGEIYNHLSLRDRLLKQGHCFRSMSDTESIIHLYEEAGPGCVPHLDGMFAFAVWDEPRRRLLLARDRLGKKPLYYARTGEKLLFASEIKALLQSPDVRRAMDMQALSYYLTFGNVPAPWTLFEGIKKLPAAHLLVCDERGEMKIERYWTPLPEEPWESDPDDGECIERVRHLIKQAVAKRLMSDVPVGAFLSGGVDSSTNVALMTELTSEPLRTISVGFRGFGEAENFHDLPYAKMVADRFGCRHSELEVTAEECLQALPQIISQQDEPNADPACIPMHFVSRAARQNGITVVLVGEGSDEVFGGYDDMAHTFRVQGGKWRRLKRLPRMVRAGIHRASRMSSATAGRVDLLRRAAEDEPLYWGLDVVFWDNEKESLLQPGGQLQKLDSASGLVQNYYSEIEDRQPGADFLQKMSYVELSNRLPELLLMRVDKHSMLHSLEARAPFLDYEVVSYVLGLPARLKVNGRTTKYVLKEAVRPYLPTEVIDRPKQGFRVPLPEWLAKDLAPWAERQLFHSSLDSLGIFQMDYIRGLWETHKAATRDCSFDLWSLINLAVWHEHWIEGKSVS